MNPFHIGDIVRPKSLSSINPEFHGDRRVMDIDGDMIRFNSPNWAHHSNFVFVSAGLLTRIGERTGVIPEPPEPEPGPWERKEGREFVRTATLEDMEKNPWKDLEKDPKGLPAAAPGAKLDRGKVEAGLLLDFGLALTEVAKVATFGAGKYSRKGWLQVPDGERRYRDAGVRHQLAGSLEDIDPDSGLLHLAHQAWNVLAELELRLRSQSK